MGKNPSHLNLSIHDWKELATNDKGKENLNKYICDGLLKVITPGGQIPKIQQMLENLGNHLMVFTESSRDVLSKNDSLDKLNVDTHPAFVGHCTAFAFPVKIFQTMQQTKIQDLGGKTNFFFHFFSNSNDFFIVPAPQINRLWKWQTFISKQKDNSYDFDIFHHLKSCNPYVKREILLFFHFFLFCLKNSAMENILQQQPNNDFEECIINVGDSDIEVLQEVPLLMKVWVRSKTSQQCVEKWEQAGEIDLRVKKPKSKAELGYAFSNLLRQKEVDRRKVSEAVQALLHLDTAKNVFVIKGKRKQIHFEKFGSAFKIISGDMVITQSDLTINSVGGDSRGSFRFIQVCSKKEASIANFIQRLPCNEEWITCSISEFLLPEEPIVDEK